MASDLILEAEKQFAKYLAGQDLKYTSQRQTILEEAFNAKDHFTADDLLDIAKNRDRSISKATLYRTLTLLTDSGLLEEHDFGEGRKSYEPVLGQHHHDHMICNQCKKIIEFENQDIERIQEEVARKHKFRILSHSHKLFGLCESCQKAGA